MNQKIIIPDNWPFEHRLVWEYDDDGDVEVSAFICGHCVHHQARMRIDGNDVYPDCKCIDHRYMHFARPWFSCDQGTELHGICKGFAPHPTIYPAGCLEWDALGGFDGWYRLWLKQWKHNRPPKCAMLNRAHQAKGREHCDDIYLVPWEDFINCSIMKPHGIHCIDYMHIERSMKSITNYKWVHEGAGLWIPWNDNEYIPI